jgi:hypothetical protein
MIALGSAWIAPCSAFRATSCDLDRHVARGALDNGRRLASEHPFERLRRRAPAAPVLVAEFQGLAGEEPDRD